MITFRWRVGSWIQLTLIASLLHGCVSGLHLYDSEREKVSQGVKKSFESANLDGTFTTARQNMAALTDAEAAQARRAVELRRDLLLLAIAGDIPCDQSILPQNTPRFYETYLACIDREINLLMGSLSDPDAVRTNLVKADSDVRTLRLVLANQETNFQLIFGSVSQPSCGPKTAASPAVPPTLLKAVTRTAPDTIDQLPGFYNDFVTNCGSYQKAIKNLHALGTQDSQYSKVVSDLTDAEDVLANARNDASRLKTMYDDAVEKYAAAVAELQNDGSKAVRDKTKAALEKAQEATKELEEVPGMFGVKALSEDRRKKIDALLEGLQGTALDPTNYNAATRLAVSALSVLPAFADGALDLAARTSKPLLGSLILTKELEQVRLAAAERQIKRAEQRVALLKQRATGLLDAARALLNARFRLGLAGEEAKDKKDRLNGPAIQAFSSGVPAEARAQLLHSLTDFGDSFTLGESRAEEATYRLVALDYDISLDRSEDAAKEWERLITVPIDRLIAFDGSGLKPEALAALITQAIGLGGIAVGVNR